MKFIVTMYGKTGPDGADVLESLSFSACESISGAQNYCNNINSIKLKEDGSWVYAKIVGEHRKITPSRHPGFGFEDIVGIDDRAMQKIMREADSQDLGMALNSASEKVQDKIFINMSRRAAGMLKEDMELMVKNGDASPGNIKTAQDKIVAIALRLADTEEIVLPGDFYEEVVV